MLYVLIGWLVLMALGWWATDDDDKGVYSVVGMLITVLILGGAFH